MSRSTAAVLFLALAAGGCGYRVLDASTGGGRALAVPTAANDSRWRGLEADWTVALRSEADRLLDVRLDAEPADLVLRSWIEDPQRGAAVRGEGGETVLGSSQLALRWVLEDRAGTRLAAGRQHRSLEFLPAAGEDARRAMLEILVSMAESVVMEIGVRLARPAADGDE